MGKQLAGFAIGDSVKWRKPHQGYVKGTITALYAANRDYLARAVVSFSEGDAQVLPLAGLEKVVSNVR